MEPPQQERTKHFQSFDIQNYKQRREDSDIELRRNRRIDEAYKRRNLTESRAWVDVNLHFMTMYTLSDLPELLEAAKSLEDEQLLKAAQGFRKLLSSSADSPIQEVIDCGIVPTIISWMERGDFPQLQYEAAWVITNIAAGNSQQTQVIFERQGVPPLVSLLSSSVDEVVEQAVWALANIGGDSAAGRDLVLQHGGMSPLVRVALSGRGFVTVKQAIWAVSNLCRGRPPPKYKQVKEGIVALAKGLALRENDLTADVCWAFSSLAEIQTDKCQGIIDAGVIPTIVKVAMECQYHTQLPALKLIGIFTSEHDLLTQSILENNALEALALGIESRNKNVKKEAVWALSNVAAGTVEQIGMMMDRGIASRVLQISLFDDVVIQKEALWTLANITLNGSLEQIEFMVRQNLIVVLHYFLQHNNHKLISIALIGLKALLVAGQKINPQANPYLTEMESMGVIDAIEQLQTHENEGVYTAVMDILENCCELEPPADTAALIQTIKESFAF